MVQTATNSKTGERFAFVGGQWVPFTNTATNQKTGEQFAFAGNEWVSLAAKAQEQEQRQKGSMLDAARDIPLSLGQGIAGGVRSITDVAGTENIASKGLRRVDDYLGQLKSASAKQDQQEIARIFQEAEDKGLGANLAAAWKAFTVAPGMSLAQGVGSIVPTAAAALLTGGVSLEAQAAARLAAAAVGAAQGVGTVKGSVRDSVYQEFRAQGVPEEQAVTVAEKAQSYSGGNLDLILAGGVLGAIAGSSGIEGALAKRIGAKAAANLTAVVKATATNAAGEVVERGVVRPAIKGFLKEGSTEALQGGQERAAQNIALQREGVNVPTMRGVLGSAAIEGLVGGILGSGVDVMKATGNRAEAQEQDDKVRAATIIVRAAAANPTEENVANAIAAFRNAGASEEDARDAVLSVFERIKQSGAADGTTTASGPDGGGDEPSVPDISGGDTGEPAAAPVRQAAPLGMGQPVDLAASVGEGEGNVRDTLKPASGPATARQKRPLPAAPSLDDSLATMQRVSAAHAALKAQSPGMADLTEDQLVEATRLVEQGVSDENAVNEVLGREPLERKAAAEPEITPTETRGVAIPYDNALVKDKNSNALIISSGEADIVDYAGRKIVMRPVNGVTVPFYLSTGMAGKANVKAGKWYPFFGVGEDGWINKGTQEEINNYYGSPELRAVSEELNATVGDIRKDNTMPSVDDRGAHIDFINQNLAPAARQQAGAAEKLRANIDATLARIRSAQEGAAPEEEAAPVAEETLEVGAPEQQINEDVAKAEVPASELEALRYEVAFNTANNMRGPDAEAASARLAELESDVAPKATPEEEVAPVADEDTAKRDAAYGLGSKYKGKGNPKYYAGYTPEEQRAFDAGAGRIPKPAVPVASEVAEAPTVPRREQALAGTSAEPKAKAASAATTPQATANQRTDIGGAALSYVTRFKGDKQRDSFLAGVNAALGLDTLLFSQEVGVDNDLSRAQYKAGLEFVRDQKGPDLTQQFLSTTEDVDYSAREDLPTTDRPLTDEDRRRTKLQGDLAAASNADLILDADYQALMDLISEGATNSQIKKNLNAAKLATEKTKAGKETVRTGKVAYEVAPNRRNFLAGLAVAMGASTVDAYTLPRTAMTGNIAIREALKTGKLQNVINAIYASTDNPTLKEVARLLKLGGVGDAEITIEDYGDAELAILGSTDQNTGNVTLNKTSNGITGDTLETALHESLHSFLAKRYRSLSTYNANNRELAGARKQQADEFIDAFVTMWRDFGNVIESKFPELLEDGGDDTVWAQEAHRSPDELFVRANTDPDLQAFLKAIDINGDKIKTPGEKSLWDRFVDMIAKLFNIQRPQAKTALSEIMGASYSVLKAAVFDAPTGEFSKAVQNYRAKEGELLQKAPKAPKTPSLNAAIRKLREDQAQTSVGVRKLQRSQAAYYGSSGELIKRTMELLDEGFGASIKGHDSVPVADALKTSFAKLSSPIFNQVVNALPTTGLIDWVRGAVGEDYARPMEELSDLVDKAIGEKGRLRGLYAKLGKRFEKFVDQYGQNELAVVYANRIDRIDPTLWAANATLDDVINGDAPLKEYARVIADPKTSTEDVEKLQRKLDARTIALRGSHAAWTKLGKQEDGHAIYKDLIGFYRSTYDQRREGMDNNLRGLGLDPDATERLIASVRLEMEQVRKNDTDKKDDVDIDESFFPDQYVPFNRYGEYWLEIPAKRGRPREFYMFETAKERDIARSRIAAERGTNEDMRWGNVIDELRSSISTESAALKRMLEILDKALEDGKIDKDTIRDQLYQVLLLTTPERSIRRQFLRSNEITGFSTDVMRGFSDSAVRNANELANLKYRQPIERQIEQVIASKEGHPLQGQLSVVAASLKSRVENSVNPTPAGAITDVLNRASFIYYLTSAATAMVQFTGIPIRVMPRLSSDYGYAAATAKAVKWMQVWKSVGIKRGDTFIPVSMETSKLVTQNPANKWAFKQLMDIGAFEGPSTAILRNRRTLDTGPARTQQKALEVVGDAISALFISSEMLSRQASAMMAFELAYEKLKKGGASETDAREKAFSAASKLTKDTLGSYSEFERPPIMKGELARSLFLFKMYSVNTTRFFVTNLKTIYRNRSAKERNAALNELTGVLLTGALFHGLTGMPLYGVVCLALDVLAGMDDDDEKRARAEKNPYTANSADARFRMDWLPEHFGNPTVVDGDGNARRVQTLGGMLQFGVVSELTDINFGSRTSFNGLWFREPKPSESTEELLTNLVIANVPFISMFNNAGRAVDAFGKGEVVRGIEAISPAFLRGFASAYRINKEGVEDTRGEDAIKRSELSNANVVAQALGLQSTMVADTLKRVGTIKGEKHKIEAKRSELMGRFNRAVTNPEGGSDNMVRALEAMRAHNAKYSQLDLQIDAEAVMDSYESFAKNNKMSYRSVIFNKNNVGDILDAFNLE